MQEDKKRLPVLFRQKEECCGCSACANACPVSAIAMQPDEEGFLYPVIDPNRCSGCGICKKTCRFSPRTVDDSTSKYPKAYGIKHKDDETRKTSRSGAAFIAFSDYVLDHNGVVYGAALQNDFSVRHIRASSKLERDRMKGAKYVQSDVAQLFSQVAEDLAEGKQVLFSGTPCQVSGLIGLLNTMHISMENLICCDLVCHGVPSPAIWKNYVSHIEKTNNSPVLAANFRDKSLGWNTHYESFILKNGKKIVNRDYTNLFYEHIMLRPACHNCHFANLNRTADISLADFWHIENNDAAFNDNKGVSLVLISSAKGAALLDAVKSQLHWFECDIKNCMQPIFTRPSPASNRRNQFWQDYSAMEFSDFWKKYTTPVTFLGKIKRQVNRLLQTLGLKKHP